MEVEPYDGGAKSGITSNPIFHFLVYNGLHVGTSPGIIPEGEFFGCIFERFHRSKLSHGWGFCHGSHDEEGEKAKEKVKGRKESHCKLCSSTAGFQYFWFTCLSYIILVFQYIEKD